MVACLQLGSQQRQMLEYLLNKDAVLKSAEGLTAEMLGDVHSREALLGLTPLMLCQSSSAFQVLLSLGADLNATSQLGLPVFVHLLASPPALGAALAALRPALPISQHLPLPYQHKPSLLELWALCMANFRGSDRIQDALAQTVDTLFESDLSAELSYDEFSRLIKKLCGTWNLSLSVPYSVRSAVLRLLGWATHNSRVNTDGAAEFVRTRYQQLHRFQYSLKQVFF